MPEFSKAEPMPTMYYGSGKVTASFPKQSFRVFCDISVPNPSDRSSYWKTAGKRAAWRDAMRWLEGKF